MKITFYLACGLLLVSYAMSGQNTYPWPQTENVGIGTTTPNHLLQLHNGNNPTLAIGKGNENTTGKSTLHFNAGTGTHQNGFSIQYRKDAYYDRLDFIDGSGLQKLSILNGGNLGIGTTSPSSKLHILSETSSALMVERLNSNLFGFEIGGSSFGLYDYTTLKYQWQSYLGNMYFVQSGGNVGIGTIDTKGYRLAVAGKAIAEEIVVKLQGNWPDYVFEDSYQLPSLSETEKYIKTNKHLPDVPSADQVEEHGLSLGKMNAILLKKVEELMLYLIEQDKKIELQQAEIDKLKRK